MNIVDIIIKKRDKYQLTEQEISYFINGYVAGNIKDYQIASLLMSIVLNGMNETESYYLTKAMVESGTVIDLSSIRGITVDKHSTGGVGDKVSLILGPILACCGLKLAKMSGRGLGHTGGTIDKLAAIPGFKTQMSLEKYLKQVNDVGMAIIAQTNDLVVADKKLYALRDVTGTVESIPLIASSIMAKKIACNTDCILLDVKVGKGAFMKDIAQAKELAKLMMALACRFKKQVKVVITDMNIPLGTAIGNTLEVKEAIAILNNKGDQRLRELCVNLASLLLVETKICRHQAEATALVNEKLQSLAAFHKFISFVKAQGGNSTYIENPNLFAEAKNIIAVKAVQSGFINEIDALLIGQLALELGAGRRTKEDKIDYSAGIILSKEIASYVNKGDVVAYLHTNKPSTAEYSALFNKALKIETYKKQDTALIKAVL